MIRKISRVGLCAALLAAAVVPAAAAPAVTRPQLVAAMKDNCFSTHTNASPAEKAKCACFAQAFVDSLTPGEIAVPQQSASINTKLKAARSQCQMGQD